MNILSPLRFFTPSQFANTDAGARTRLRCAFARAAATLGLATAAGLAQAAPAPSLLSAILDHQRQYGFVSPPAAIAQLTMAAEQAGPQAPLALRMNYHASLANYFILAEQAPQVEAELRELNRMARNEQCAPCQQYLLIRQLEWDLQRLKLDQLRPKLAVLDALPALPDPALQAALFEARAAGHQANGSHDRALESATRAVELAAQTPGTAAHVRALKLLALANSGRGDLPLAARQIVEAHAKASKLGFSFMMVELRMIEAWIHARNGANDKRYLNLIDALMVSRSEAGLADSELIVLVTMAEFHSEQKEYPQAAKLAALAIELAERQQKPLAKAMAMVTLGAAQVHQGDLEPGLVTIEASIALLETLGANSYLEIALDDIATIYERYGRHRPALDSLRKAVALKQRASQERDLAVAEAQKAFVAERKARARERLEAEQAARAWQLRLWGALALAVVLGAVLLSQFIKRRNSRRGRRAGEANAAAHADPHLHDPLTGAFTLEFGHTLMGRQEALLASTSRDRHYEACVGLLLLDADRFMQVNESFGRHAGDRVLVEIVRRLKSLLREKDIVARREGAQFVLMLPGTAAEGLVVLAERVLCAMGEQLMVHEGTAIPVTLSAGSVAWPLVPGQKWEDALTVAELALGQAKQRDGNRAVCVISASKGTSAEIGDLAAAAQSGVVVLRTIIGVGAIETVRDAVPETT